MATNSALSLGGDKAPLPEGPRYFSGLQSRLTLFTMLLFVAFNGTFSVLSFAVGDIYAATTWTAAGLISLVGVAAHILLGWRQTIGLIYGLSAFCIYVFLIARGGDEYMGLLGALALAPGFVAILGWRPAAWFLALMLLLTAMVFYGDWYLEPQKSFPPSIELKFFMAFFGLSLFAISFGFAWEKSYRELAEHSAQVEALAYIDPMTELPNRRAIESQLAQRWEEYRRSNGPFAILLCNIDNIKGLNNKYGQDFGDGVIIRVANALERCLRSQDISSRWGGDEFLIILPGQMQSTAVKAAERLRRRIEGIELAMYSEPVTVTVSIGVASVESALSPEDLVSVADAGLYQAKNMGKNRVVCG